MPELIRVGVGGLRMVAEIAGGQKYILPLSRLSVGYTLNSIPEATVSPATGVELFKLNTVGVNRLQPDQKASLWIQINGRPIELLRGRIQTIGGNSNGSMFDHKIGLEIKVTHVMSSLAGAPTTSFGYTQVGTLLNSVENTKVNVSIFDPANPVSAILAPEVDTDKYSAYANKPVHVLRGMCRGLLEQFQQTADVAEYDEYFPPPPDSGPQLGFIVVPVTILDKLGKAFRNKWVEGNAWEALSQTARWFMLGIIPTPTKMFISSPYSLLRTPHIRLSPGEYTSISRSTAASHATRVDGVIVRPAVANSYSSALVGSPDRSQYVFPKDDAGGMVLSRYYHYRQFPSWFSPEYNWTRRDLPLSAGRFPDAADRTTTEQVREQQDTVGERFARSLFGELSHLNASCRITLPFRTDIMPGTILALDPPADAGRGRDTSEPDRGVFGSALYGMVSSVHITADASEKGDSLGMTCTLVNVRNEKYNKDPDRTYDGHPLYTSVWPGVDLFGNLLNRK